MRSVRFKKIPNQQNPHGLARRVRQLSQFLTGRNQEAEGPAALPGAFLLPPREARRPEPYLCVRRRRVPLRRWGSVKLERTVQKFGSDISISLRSDS